MTRAPASQHPTRVVGYDPDTDTDFPLASGSGGGGGAVEELQASTVAHATVAASATIAALVAANADRRRFIATNPKASTQSLGLSVKNNATFAQCEIILAPGESWVEALASASAWYVITESGSITVPVQTAE